MSELPWKRFATGALPIAISAGIQASGLAGTVVSVMAWGIAAAVVLYLLFDAMGDPGSGEDDVGHDARVLGKELIDFSQTRQTIAPSTQRDGRPFAGSGLLGFRPPRRPESTAFEADTMSLFNERFGDRVVRVIDKLREAGRLGVREAQILISPSGPTGIEALGQRLIELGYPES